MLLSQAKRDILGPFYDSGCQQLCQRFNLLLGDDTLEHWTVFEPERTGRLLVLDEHDGLFFVVKH